jgi:hypothetical protein
MRVRTTATRTAVVLVCAALALTACSDDGGDDADPTVTASTTESADTEPTDTPTADATDDEDDESSDDDRDCRTSDLRVSVRDLDSAPGRRYAEVVVVNATGEACTVEGFGGLQLLDRTRNPVPTRLVRLTRPAARPVVLDPGGAAVSEINFSVVATDADQSTGPCQPRPRYALVTPPDEDESTRIPWNLGPVCDEGRIEQKSYQPGPA